MEQDPPHPEGRGGHGVGLCLGETELGWVRDRVAEDNIQEFVMGELNGRKWERKICEWAMSATGIGSREWPDS